MHFFLVKPKKLDFRLAPSITESMCGKLMLIQMKTNLKISLGGFGLNLELKLVTGIGRGDASLAVEVLRV